MNQQLQNNPPAKPSPWWKQHPSVSGFAGGVLLISLIIAGYWWPESGFDGQPIDLLHREEPKQLWDWLELLIVPFVLAGGGLLFSRAERENERKIADARREQDQKIADDQRKQEQEIADVSLRESALQLYFDRMSELLLRDKLRDQIQDNPAHEVARARTVTTLRRLKGDSDRVAAVVDFLHEAHLVQSSSANDGDKGIALLAEAHMTGLDLRFARFFSVDINKADMRDCNLQGAVFWRSCLVKTNLCKADLSHADLTGSDLTEAPMILANLSFAQLIQTQLNGASLYLAVLRDCILGGADLRGADIGGADLSGAYIGKADFRGAKNIEVEQIQVAHAWEEAIYDDDFRAKLGLPPQRDYTTKPLPPLEDVPPADQKAI